MQLAQKIAEFDQTRIRLQIAALDIGVRDTRAAAFDEDFIAWTDDMLARLNLQLLRPARLRQQTGDAEAMGGERRQGLIEPSHFALAHQIQPDLARRNGAGMTVLHPEHDLLVRRGRGQTGIEIRRP